MYTALGFDAAALMRANAVPLRGDFVHEPTHTLVEFDELQHFTTARRMTLDLYPDDIPLGFDLAEYKALCRSHCRQADKYRATKDAWGYGPGGRMRQRAYYDALRDLAAPAVGFSAVVRIPCFDNNGAGAYRRHRDSLRFALAM